MKAALATESVPLAANTAFRGFLGLAQHEKRQKKSTISPCLFPCGASPGKTLRHSAEQLGGRGVETTTK